MILLCGIPSEAPLALVRQQLEELDVPYTLIDQRNLDDTEVEFGFTDSSVTGVLEIADKRYPLEGFDGVYTRLVESDSVPPTDERGDDALKRLHRLAVYDALLAWFEVSPARVVNRPTPMGSNFSKPYQLQLIRAQGFAVPETLVTNDPDLARAFWREHKHVIYKSISSTRSIVQILSEEDSERLDHILWCPTQFQAFVDGVNIRVHTVDKAVYASAIITDAIDYRYAYRQGKSAEIHEIDLPEELAQRCVRLAEVLELPFTGIDLKITAQNCAYCLEVNTSPAFSYYEEQTGQPISRALACYLAEVGAGTLTKC
jgi:glutathione synthase/RimK-type ligase-like ATP-grasp enzyme